MDNLNKATNLSMMKDVLPMLRKKRNENIPFEVYYSECPLEYIRKARYASYNDFIKKGDYYMRRDIFPFMYVRFI